MLKQGHTSKSVARSRLLFWSVGCALALGVGAVLYGAADTNVNDDAGRRFENLARSTQYGISARIKSYSDLTRGLVALFQTSDDLTRLQFHQYVASLEIPRHFPAIEAVTWAPLVTDEQRDAFVARVRADRSMSPQGYPDFDIKPPGRRPHYAVLTYLEPASMMGEKMGVDVVANPMVDKLVSALVAADSRPQLVAASRALDRVLLHKYIVVPHWYSGTHRVAYRNRFGIPATSPKYYQADPYVISSWWQAKPR